MKEAVASAMRKLAPFLVLGWVVLAAFPVYYIVVTSLKTQADYLKPPPWAFPEKWTLENYRAVLESGFLRYFSNSVWVATTVAIASVALSLLVAYGVVRSSSRVFRGSFYLFILGFAIPAQATVISLYTLARSVGLYDTLWAITLPLTGFAMPVTVIVFSNFLREIPPALFEAMAIEGAGHLTILRHLVLPLSLRAVLSMGLFNFIGAWNALLFPLILTESPEVRVLPMAVWAFTGQFGINVPAVMAAVTLSALPLIVAYVFARREILNALRGGLV